MERGFEQFFVLVAIIIAGVADLIVRWIRRKAGKDQPPVVADVSDVADAAEAPGPAEEDYTPVSVSFPQRSPPLTVRRRRRHRAHRWLTHPLDARSGIVLMAILGPCRGLQAPHSDV